MLAIDKKVTFLQKRNEDLLREKDELTKKLLFLQNELAKRHNVQGLEQEMDDSEFNDDIGTGTGADEGPALRKKK